MTREELLNVLIGDYARYSSLAEEYRASIRELDLVAGTLSSLIDIIKVDDKERMEAFALCCMAIANGQIVKEEDGKMIYENPLDPRKGEQQ